MRRVTSQYAFGRGHDRREGVTCGYSRRNLAAESPTRSPRAVYQRRLVTRTKLTRIDAGAVHPVLSGGTSPYVTRSTVTPSERHVATASEHLRRSLARPAGIVLGRPLAVWLALVAGGRKSAARAAGTRRVSTLPAVRDPAVHRGDARDLVVPLERVRRASSSSASVRSRCRSDRSSSSACLRRGSSSTRAASANDGAAAVPSTVSTSAPVSFTSSRRRSSARSRSSSPKPASSSSTGSTSPVGYDWPLVSSSSRKRSRPSTTTLSRPSGIARGPRRRPPASRPRAARRRR